jgi:hypothetical protein
MASSEAQRFGFWRPSIRAALCLLALGVTGCFLLAGQAKAAPGAYRVLIAEAHPQLAKKLGAQIAAFPDVAAVDLVSTETETPTAARLAGYDLVVSIGDSTYLDRFAWGNSLADYVDSGGVVVQYAYDSWEDGFPEGRFDSGGYAPFAPGPADNFARSLGTFDASSPLMQGVGTLESGDNTTPSVVPGASLIANWDDGGPAVALKGRVVSVSAFTGDEYGEVWSGDFGRLSINAVRMLGRRTLTVVNLNPTGGTVTSSAGGIVCGAICSGNITFQSPVSLAAIPNRGFAFAGFGGSCAGTACGLTMDGPKTVTAAFTSFVPGNVRLNKKKGTAQLTVAVGGPGSLAVSGKKIKQRSKTAAEARNVKVPIVAKGKAVSALKKTGKARVKLTLAFTPPGGLVATLPETVVLRLRR